MQWRGWPKTRPSPYVLSCPIRSFCVKGCRHTGEPKKLGRAETPLYWGGRHVWPQDTRPCPTSNMIVLRQRVHSLNGLRCTISMNVHLLLCENVKTLDRPPRKVHPHYMHNKQMYSKQQAWSSIRYLHIKFAAWILTIGYSLNYFLLTLSDNI